MPEEKNYFKIKAISSHLLQYFEESPLSFIKQLNGELEEDDNKKYLEFGKQVHMRILEPKRFKQCYTVLDYETPKSEQQKQFCLAVANNELVEEAYSKSYSVKGKSDEKILQEAIDLESKLQDYIQYLIRTKKYKDILSFAKKAKIDSCYNQCLNHSAAKELLIDDEFKKEHIDTYSELEILWNHPLYPNIPCKSMIDRLVIDHNTKTIKIIDIKTAMSFKAFKDQYKEFNYARQLAFYSYAVFHFLKELNIYEKMENYKVEYYIVVIKHTPHQEVKVVPIPQEDISIAINEIELLFKQISWHWGNDLWDHTKQYYEGDYFENLI